MLIIVKLTMLRWGFKAVVIGVASWFCCGDPYGGSGSKKVLKRSSFLGTFY